MESKDAADIQTYVECQVAADIQKAVESQDAADIQISEDVGITVATKSNSNKRKWDRRNYCVYCLKPYPKLARHILAVHKTEAEVKDFACLPPKSKQRRSKIKILTMKGNHLHNTEVLKSGTGTLLPARRTAEIKAPEDYLPCEFCSGWFQRNLLWKHQNNCELVVQKKRHCNVQARGSLLLPISQEMSENFRCNVLGIMRQDDIARVVRSDNIIIQFGEKLYKKHGHKKHLHGYISQKMRELARFLIAARQLDLEVSCLQDCLIPAKFPLCPEASKMAAGFNEETHTFKTPSLGLKLGHSLKTCAKILRNRAIVNGEKSAEIAATQFIGLCTDDWKDEISTHALRTLRLAKLNKSPLLPLASDIRTLHEYLDENIQSHVESFRRGKLLLNDWSELAQLILAKVTLFNRRRGGEAERMDKDEYNEAKTAGIKSLDDSDVKECLSPMEIELCKHLIRIEIVGKRDRLVPVILTTQMVEYIDILIESRPSSIASTYLFARPGVGATTPHRCSDALRKFAHSCGATCPERLTSTKLRKHIATMCQLLNLKKNELDIIAKFMGHDIIVHRDFYRLSQETLQLAKVSKLLLAFEKGNIQEYRGKSLEEIDISPDCSTYY